MSSSSFNVIRKHSSDATSIRIKELTQALAKQRSDIAGSQLETDDVRSQGRMDHSTIKLNDESLKFVTTLNSGNSDIFYEFPNEPDFTYLKVWFMLDHLGARMRDMSGLGNDAYIAGHPTLRRAGLNLGFQQTLEGGGTSATPVMLFNSGTDVVSQTNGEYIWIPDNTSIQFTQFTVGFSICFRFNCLNFNSHVSEFGTFQRRFAAKTDNVTNGWNLVVYSTNAEGTTGGIEMNVLHDNVTYKRRTTGYNINSWYQVVVTYDPNLSANLRIKIYTAGTENSMDGITTLLLPTHSNLRIGARSVETGFFYGYIHDFRLYMDKVLTQTEITNLNQNEMTIDNITKGRVFVIQYALVSSLFKTKTHRYTVGGFVDRDRIHKFNLIGKLTRTRTHKYTILNALSRTRIHKYTVTGMVQRLRTHKYNMGGVVTLSKTHKYNIEVQTPPILVQVVRFQKDTSGVANATQDVNLNFTPKAIIVYSNTQTGNATTEGHYQWSQGFSDGTTSACTSIVSEDGANPDTQRYHSNISVYVRMLETSNASVAESATVAFGTNKVTFTWVTNTTAATYIHLVAYGGDSITNAKVNTVSVGRTGIGTQSYTGLGFTPTTGNAVLFTLCQNKVAAGTSTSASQSMGCAVSPTKRWSIANAMYNNVLGNSMTWRATTNDKVIHALNVSDGILYQSADFNGWVSGGFSLNWTTNTGGSSTIFSYLVINGGTWDAGTLTSPTSITNDVNYSVAVSSKTLRSLMIAGCGDTASGTISTTARMSFGATDGTTQTHIANVDEHAQATTDSYRFNNTTNIAAPLGVDGARTDIATFDSFTTNNFRLDWPTKSAIAQLYGWVVVADI